MPRSDGTPDARVGRIHSIESFGTVDGPGIRAVVFFQGCHLRCLYCHNRDTWLRSAGHETTVDALVSDVLRFRAWFDRSGGGVTASGGDPILQAGFVAEFFAGLRQAGIHTALDTSGLTRITPQVERLIDESSLVLLDIKHVDDAPHRQLTGASNRLTLEFGRYLAGREQPMWLRHVIIPGWTDDPQSAAAFAEYDRSLGSAVERVELLPYHDFGSEKWARLRLPYPLEGTAPPDAATMTRVERHFRERDLPVVIP